MERGTREIDRDNQDQYKGYTADWIDLVMDNWPFPAVLTLVLLEPGKYGFKTCFKQTEMPIKLMKFLVLEAE